MASVCSHFAALEARIAHLTAKFVKDQIAAESADPAGFTADLDRLAAFRLLTHAEVEEFLEAKAREGLAQLTTALAAPGLALRDICELFALASVLGRPVAMSWPYDASGFLAEAGHLIRAGEQVIAENNGVKGSSFFQLSVMAGKMPDEIDGSLGASLTSYGKSRGDVAHKSVVRVRTLRAPSAEAKDAADLVRDLAAYFDVRSS